MGKYTKITSSYIKREKHKDLRDGSKIFERDWGTIGERHRLEKGKRVVYGSQSFLFTNNIFKNYRYVKDRGDIISSWVEEELDKVNNLTKKEDEYLETIKISDFAYYGSCVELVRVSIEEIVEKFPPIVKSSVDKVYWEENRNGVINDGYLEEYYLKNSFGVDFVLDKPIEKELKDTLRYLTYSFDRYEINGLPITSYVVKDLLKEERDRYKGNNYQFICENNYNKVYEIYINGELVINVYIYDEELLFTTPKEDLEISVNKSERDKFYDSLSLFSKKLLNRDSNPLYTCIFEEKKRFGKDIKVVKKKFTFPNDGKFGIEVDGLAYQNYISSIYEFAESLDNSVSDNIYKRMTHESLIQFDYSNTDIISDSLGDNKFAKLLRVLGRGFDDLRLRLNKIKRNDGLSYNLNKNSLTSLKEKLNMKGLKFNTIIPFYQVNETYKKEELLKSYSIINGDKYYYFKNKLYDFVDYEKEFYKNYLLNLSYINSSKGTKNSIYQVLSLFGFGENEIEIEEEIIEIEPKRYEEVSDKLIRIAQERENDYVNEFSNSPLKSIDIMDKKMIVPYYDKNIDYKNDDLYFQGKGSWLKYKNSDGETIKRVETKNYLIVVSNIEEMLNLSPHDIKQGEFVFVENLTDLSSKGFEVKEKFTHFFKMINIFNTNNVNSWKNIDEEDEDYKECLYLYSVKNDNEGNNPHIGYGDYDEGETYNNLLFQPFLKEGIDYKFSEDELNEFATDFEFNNKKIRVDSKIKPYLRIDKFNEDKIYKKGDLFYYEKDGVEQVYKTIKTNENKGSFESREDNFEISAENDFFENKEKYYLNTKRLFIKNKVENDLFKDYFKNIIMKYLEEVIPSTSIVILENF